MAGCLGGSGDDGEAPERRELAAGFVTGDVPEVKRLAAVRRSPQGLGRRPPSGREVGRARRIMAGNPYFTRITDDAGGFEISRTGIVGTAGPDRILGLVVEVRLDRPVDRIYELPLACHGVVGPPFALPATPYELDDVSALSLLVTFADRRVAAIEARNGLARPRPEAAYLSAPSSCARFDAEKLGG